MEMTTDSLTEHYKTLSDDDLQRVWSDYSSLTENALTALSVELMNRRLISQQDVDSTTREFRELVRAAANRGEDNRIYSAERLGISLSITGVFMVGYFLLCWKFQTDLKDQAFGQWLRFGFFVGVLCGFIREKWLTRLKLMLIVASANLFMILILIFSAPKG